MDHAWKKRMRERCDSGSMKSSTSDADHGEAAVLDLSELHAAISLREHEMSIGDHERENRSAQGGGKSHLLVEAEGVEAEVTGLAGRAVEHLEDSGEGDDLDETNPKDDLMHSKGLLVAGVSPGDEGIVGASHLGLSDDLLDSLRPNSFRRRQRGLPAHSQGR